MASLCTAKRSIRGAAGSLGVRRGRDRPEWTASVGPAYWSMPACAVRRRHRLQVTNQAPILSVVVQLGETECLGEIAGPPACGEPFSTLAFPPQDLFAPLVKLSPCAQV